jgi:hypothetical protein
VKFWARLRGIFGGREQQAAPVERPVVEAKVTAAMRAAHAVAEHNFVAARDALHAAQQAADEGSVLDAILISLPDESPSENAAWDDLILLVADVLVARGDRARACEHLRRARSNAARVLRADLLCEGIDGAAKPEDLDLALSLLAEVLRADIDTPGARDRWERLRTRLGRGGQIGQLPIGATLLVDGPALPFTLVREVARGGAGVVYEAKSAIGVVERTVALKLAHQRASAKTFLAHEARIAVRFRGPGIVPILDVDPNEGWLAMGWAASGSLRQHLRAADGPIAHEPRAWIRVLVSVLAEIHRERWIHGDLKPANVLFDRDGAPWLGDFALARPFGDPATPGSAGYVSQARMNGAPCHPRDDLFGLGKILEEVAQLAGDERLRSLARECLSDTFADATDVLVALP